MCRRMGGRRRAALGTAGWLQSVASYLSYACVAEGGSKVLAHSKQAT